MVLSPERDDMDITMSLGSEDLDSYLLDTEDTQGDDDLASATDTDRKKLTQAWMNERAAPEILEYERTALENMLEMIENQTAIIEENQTHNEISRFKAMLYETEVERIRFIVKSYLRTRLCKIENYAQAILDDPEYRQRLSERELQYAEGYQGLIEKHYQDSCLNALPPILQRLDERHGNISMVRKPDLDSAVFCRVKRDVGEFHVGENNVLMMNRGDIYMLRYRAVQQLLVDQTVELL